jgi:hypothetical protein
VARGLQQALQERCRCPLAKCCVLLLLLLLLG